MYKQVLPPWALPPATWLVQSTPAIVTLNVLRASVTVSGVSFSAELPKIDKQIVQNYFNIVILVQKLFPGTFKSETLSSSEMQ